MAKRRLFLKGTLAGGVLGVAAGAGLLRPTDVLAAWPAQAFEAKNVDDALTGLFGSSAHEASDAIKIKAPDIAENGAVVPVTVSTDMADVAAIGIVAEANAQPLAAVFHLSERTLPDVSTRIKMGKTANVLALVKTADGVVHSAAKEVKVTIGGCGG